MSADRGTSLGTLLDIHGTSFGGLKEDYEILAEGLPCVVKNLTANYIQCEVSAGTPTP